MLKNQYSKCMNNNFMSKYGKEGDHDKEAQTAREAVPYRKLNLFYREANKRRFN